MENIPNLKRKIVVVLCVAYLVGMGFFLPFYPVAADETFPTTGIIAMWTGPTVPDGWEIVAEANDRFVIGTSTGESPGVMGGASSHDHAYTSIPTHNHGYTNTQDFHHNHPYDGGLTFMNTPLAGSDILAFNPAHIGPTGMSESTHVHTVGTTGSATCYTEDAENVLPPYYNVTYIKKVSHTAVYPVGLIVISTESTVPEGWVVCDGENETPDLSTRFLSGSDIPGGEGGALTHSHMYSQVPAHSHSMQADGGTHNHENSYGTHYLMADTALTFAGDVGRAYLSQTYTAYNLHSHSVPTVGSLTCNTQQSSNLPSYVAVDFLMNTIDTPELPVGVTCLWDGEDSIVPTGWNVCNGTAGTIDMRDKFMRGRDGESLGDLGGSPTHSHIYTQVPSHTHTISTENVEHRHNLWRYHSNAVAAVMVVGTAQDSFVNELMRNVAWATPSHKHLINNAGVTNPSNQAVSSNPPFIKLTYIQYTDYHDGLDPKFSSTPSDRPLEYGYTGETISWTATDDTPALYTIDLLGSGQVEGPTAWSSSVPIVYDVPDGFEIGSYTYEIELFDGFGNSYTDSVTLTVQDSTDPTLTQVPTPINVEFGYSGQSFSWTANDLNPDVYSIELIGTGIVDGPTAWVSGSPILYNIPDGFSPGTYTYKITFLDLYLNEISNEVTFAVGDTIAPEITSTASDVTVEEEYTGQEFSWTATDPNSGTYTIELEGTGIVVDHTAWVSGTAVTYNIPDGFTEGLYTYTITFYDEFSNVVTDSVIFAVTKPTIPGFSVGWILIIGMCSVVTTVLVVKKRKNIVN